MKIRIKENITGRDGTLYFTAGVVYHVVEKGDYSVTAYDNDGVLTALFNDEFVVSL